MAQLKVKRKKKSAVKKVVRKKVTRKKSLSKKSPAKKLKNSKASKAELIDLTLIAQTSFKPSEKSLSTWVNRIALALQERSSSDKRLSGLSWAGAALTIAFLNEEPARDLNKRFRGRDYATDVLSFGDESPGVLGELAICPEVVLRQAREHGISFDEELGYMILHGILHLLGFDHEESKSESRAMLELQDDVFNELRPGLLE